MDSVSKKPNSSFSFMVNSNEFFIPMSNAINVESEIKKMQKELDYNKGFLKSVESKLNNERFMNNAPKKIITNEQNKMTDAKSKIRILENKISSLK
jgi:valyl-tRNA synthetase